MGFGLGRNSCTRGGYGGATFYSNGRGVLDCGGGDEVLFLLV